jgi:hypothetical protein
VTFARAFSFFFFFIRLILLTGPTKGPAAETAYRKCCSRECQF